MEKERDQQQRQQNAEADQRPGRAPPPGLQLQQEQTAQTEHQTGDREHVDETAPDRAGVAALVQIIVPGDPTTIGRSEKRRVGKESGCTCRSLWWAFPEKTNKYINNIYRQRK